MKRKPTYTHRDASGMLWRFVGSRPVSELADKVVAEEEAGDNLPYPERSDQELEELDRQEGQEE